MVWAARPGSPAASAAGPVASPAGPGASTAARPGVWAARSPSAAVPVASLGPPEACIKYIYEHNTNELSRERHKNEGLMLRNLLKL